MPHCSNIPLTYCWLYAVTSKKDLARRLSTKRYQLTAKDLEDLASDKNYEPISGIVTGGKKRNVYVPSTNLEKVLKRIHNLMSRVETPEYLHSTTPGTSYITNAKIHSRLDIVGKIDIKSYFFSIKRERIFRFFYNDMKCKADAAGLLADLATFDNHLPLGSNASPILAFYASKTMLDEIYNLSLGRDIKMTCYIDDLTFSGIGVNRGFMHEIHKIIALFGLRSHKVKIFSPGENRMITGVYRTKGGDAIPHQLHQKISEGIESLPQIHGKTQRKKHLQSLLGRLNAASQINPRYALKARSLKQSYGNL